VHVSRLADRFVKDPHDVVKPGDIVRVRVLEVDLERKRIALTMRFDRKPQPSAQRPPAPRPARDVSRGQTQAPRRPPRPVIQQAPAKAPAAETAMGAAFSRLLGRP
jgi:uncharacterized protein